MNQLATDFDMESFLNYQFPTTDSVSCQTAPDADLCSPTSTEFLSKNSSLFSSIEPWDFSAYLNSPILEAQTMQVDTSPADNWRANCQDKIDALLKTRFSHHQSSSTSRDAWSPASSTEPESEQNQNNSFPDTPTSFTGPEESIFPKPLSKAEKTRIAKENRIERRREKNRASQRKFRKRKEEYIKELETQNSDLQKRYDALVTFFCGKDNVDVAQRESWDWESLVEQNLMDPFVS